LIRIKGFFAPVQSKVSKTSERQMVRAIINHFDGAGLDVEVFAHILQPPSPCLTPQISPFQFALNPSNSGHCFWQSNYSASEFRAGFFDLKDTSRKLVAGAHP